MKSLIKTALVLAFLFTPAFYVIAPALVVCLAMDTVLPAPVGLDD
jgi:hypothetical protein